MNLRPNFFFWSPVLGFLFPDSTSKNEDFSASIFEPFLEGFKYLGFWALWFLKSGIFSPFLEWNFCDIYRFGRFVVEVGVTPVVVVVVVVVVAGNRAPRVTRLLKTAQVARKPETAAPAPQLHAFNWYNLLAVAVEFHVWFAQTSYQHCRWVCGPSLHLGLEKEKIILLFLMIPRALPRVPAFLP